MLPAIGQGAYIDDDIPGVPVPAGKLKFVGIRRRFGVDAAQHVVAFQPRPVLFSDELYPAFLALDFLPGVAGQHLEGGIYRRYSGVFVNQYDRGRAILKLTCLPRALFSRRDRYRRLYRLIRRSRSGRFYHVDNWFVWYG